MPTSESALSVDFAVSDTEDAQFVTMSHQILHCARDGW